ncbi:MAG: AEC family transporter [Woeseiaceae bacterium]
MKRAAFLPEDTWPGMEKLTYFVLFPALLVGTLGNQSLDGVPWPRMLAVVVGTLAIAATALVLWYRFRPSLDGPIFTSIFQGGVRFNTYIALAIAQAFFGFEGLTLAAVAAGLMIVLINLLCVFILIMYGKAGSRGITPYVREVAGNPLVLGCAIGWFLSLSGIGLPGITEDILEIVGRAALPFGLLAVGAALKPEAVPGHAGSIAISSIVQFGLKPACAVLLISGVGLSGVAAAVVLVAFMVPTAPSAYILARQLGGDAETMASIITFQTLLAFLVMPIIATVVLG